MEPFRAFLRRQRKIRGGSAPGARPVYDPRSWWDHTFYSEGVSDARTISRWKDPYAARFHYAALELLISRELYKAKPSLERVVDIGSGAGHWVDFYLELGAEHVTAVDISETAAMHLRDRYDGDSRVEVKHGEFADLLEPCTLVSAIGVLFHVVDDAEWQRGIGAIGANLHGLLVVGGHFGYWPSRDVQFGDEGVNKRLRPRRRWRAELQAQGFYDLNFRRNLSYLFIGESQPESSLLFARHR